MAPEFKGITVWTVAAEGFGCGYEITLQDGSMPWDINKIEREQVVGVLIEFLDQRLQMIEDAGAAPKDSTQNEAKKGRHLGRLL